ncbi:phage holin family protein [Bradyrhizobium elkanii]|uniref:phage holin family protein n=1 Tax=Bradyrhizobium elkanii TaxID=29448 RepID=UPI003D2057C1
MDWLQHFLRQLEPVQFIYGIVATCGGVARYLTGIADGKAFSLTVFIASAFVAGFSGWMFALLGMSLNMPQSMVFMMAGTGGFMGEQTMKLIAEYLQAKIK